MALLKLADKYSIERLDAACAKALSYTEQAILKSGRDKIQEESYVFPSSSEYGLTRGADYFSKRMRYSPISPNSMRR
ncbi:hypothetical protein Psch_01726 [Pelotomaculum schinkii]|uniref:Uncharacterized protein n=1 Tax=Pelotomaculum schinkii TaxID=78350 RepID=A0A4Y7RHA0_9FIRM|nr:hypothetical protein Psch_01726 [Pelotomaculum schinkii]